MLNHRTEVQILVDLGLNSLQAKLYLNLAKFGPSSQTAIAKRSKVSATETRNELANLYELGIVQKVSEKPKLFKATSADQTLKFLMQRKLGQTNELRFGTNGLSSNLIIKRNQFKEQNRLVSISKKEVVLNRAMEAICQVEDSMDLVLSWDQFLECTHFVNQEIIKPNIAARFIVEQPSNLDDLGLLKKFRHCLNNIRFIQTAPKALLGIYDKKDVMIIENPDSEESNSSSMWTSTQSLIIMVQSYFENLWLKASKEPIEQNSV